MLGLGSKTKNILVLMSVSMLLVGMLYAPTALASAVTSEHQDKDNKCKKHKYNGECDFKKPTIVILIPKAQAQLSGSTVIVTGVAFDADSGIKRVEASMKGSPFGLVSTHDGAWTFVTPSLSPGWHTVKARAIDNAGNEQWTFVVFKLLPAV